MVFLSFIYYTFAYLSSSTVSVEKVDDTKIQSAQKSIKQTLELNTSTKANNINETNTTIENIEVKLKKEIEVEESTISKRSLKIVPKNKVWAGYIEIETNKKYQNIFKKEKIIDATKNWLLLFGAGTVKLEVNGELKTFVSKRNIRLKYKDGELSKISVKEFKSLNKGRKW